MCDLFSSVFHNFLVSAVCANLRFQKLLGSQAYLLVQAVPRSSPCLCFLTYHSFTWGPKLGFSVRCCGQHMMHNIYLKFPYVPMHGKHISFVDRWHGRAGWVWNSEERTMQKSYNRKFTWPVMNLQLVPRINFWNTWIALISGVAFALLVW